MTRIEQRSGEKGLSPTRILILLLIAAGLYIGYDWYQDGQGPVEEDKSGEHEDDNGNNLGSEIRGMSTLMQNLDFLLPENLDVHWTLEATSGINVTDTPTYLRRFRLFASAYENNAELLLDRAPDALRYFGDLRLAGLTNWADTLTPDEILSQNFASVLNTEEGQDAFVEANNLFNNSLVTRTVNGEPTLIFAERPGSDEAGYENLWIPSPDGTTVYAENIVQGFDTAQKALYAQVIGYIRLYADVHNIEWSTDAIESSANRITATYLQAGFRPVGGYTPTYTLEGRYATQTPFYILSSNIETRMLIAEPNEEREGQWQCATIVNIPEGEPSSFGTFDYENAFYTDGGSGMHPEHVDRMTDLGVFTTFLIDNNNEVLNLRMRQTSDADGFDGIPGSYENDNPAVTDNGEALLYEFCAPTVTQPIVQPTPEAEYIPPQDNPETPPETPENEDDKKSPNGDIDGDGGYSGGPFDDDQPVDEEADEPVPLPTAPPADGEPPTGF